MSKKKKEEKIEYKAGDVIELEQPQYEIIFDYYKHMTAASNSRKIWQEEFERHKKNTEELIYNMFPELEGKHNYWGDLQLPRLIVG